MFDVRHGTITRRTVPVECLGIGGDRAFQAMSYQPSSATLINKMVRASGVDPAVYTFADLGCGRGGVLCIAAEIGFRRVIGVELSPHLARDAAELAARFNNVAVVLGDALAYRFPDGPLFVFLYNPFDADALRELVKSLPPCIAGYANSVHAQEQPLSGRCPLQVRVGRN